MKRILSIVVIILVIFVLSETNPERKEYIDWMNNKSMNESSNILEKGILSVAGESFFDAGTTRKDYFIFSIYKTDFSEVGLGNSTSIGIFNKFFSISKTKE
ncbi:DUF4359 domain-containing protein [Neobacillus vireti]|uniref:DUF4359 domain-containing protein n=1 Tax=Neobacillus vireti TaxID=220686 RepID=UPI002FFF5D6C